jgi:hypothetical protein
MGGEIHFKGTARRGQLGQVKNFIFFPTAKKAGLFSFFHGSKAVFQPR